MQKKTRWQDGMNLVWGIWLFFSPFTLNFSGVASAAWNSYIFGCAVSALSVLALRRPQAWEEWAHVLIAFWLFLSPFVLGFGMNADATSNAVILSLLIGMDALWVITQPREQETA